MWYFRTWRGSISGSNVEYAIYSITNGISHALIVSGIRLYARLFRVVSGGGKDACFPFGFGMNVEVARE